MKKIVVLLISSILYMSGFAQKNDTSEVIKRNLQSLQHRPRWLSENQAIHLMVHPDEIDSIRVDTLLRANSFSFLPLTNNWKYEFVSIPVYFSNGNWIQKRAVSIYETNRYEEHVFICLLLTGFIMWILYFISKAVTLKKNITEALKWGKNKDARGYLKYYNSKVKSNFFLRQEVILSLFVFCIISLLADSDQHVIKLSLMFFLSFLFWTLLMCTMTYLVRNLIAQWTINYVSKKYFLNG